MRRRERVSRRPQREDDGPDVRLPQRKARGCKDGARRLVGHLDDPARTDELDLGDPSDVEHHDDARPDPGTRDPAARHHQPGQLRPLRCASIRPFTKQIEAKSKGLGANPAHTVAAGKALLHGYLESLLSLTGQTVAKLRKAGVPGVPAGKQLARSVIGAFTTLAAELRRAATETEDLPDDVDGFKAGAKKVGGELRSSLGRVGKGLVALDSPGLASATEADRTCAGLVG